MRISDWSSDVCSSDLRMLVESLVIFVDAERRLREVPMSRERRAGFDERDALHIIRRVFNGRLRLRHGVSSRSEEHTSDLQSLMRISYAVFCLKTQNKLTPDHHFHNDQKTYRTPNNE